jgi:hypothetical protein
LVALLKVTVLLKATNKLSRRLIFLSLLGILMFAVSFVLGLSIYSNSWYPQYVWTLGIVLAFNAGNLLVATDPKYRWFVTDVWAIPRPLVYAGLALFNIGAVLFNAYAYADILFTYWYYTLLVWIAGIIMSSLIIFSGVFHTGDFMIELSDYFSRLHF